MPREKSPSKSKSNHEETRSWVLLLQNKILHSDEETLTLDMVKLKHPRTGVGAMYLFSSDNSVIHEILCFSDKRSWFINDTVKEDGKIFFSTPIDPLFLVLPVLKKSSNEGKVMPLEDLFFDQSFPDSQRLLKTVIKRLHLIGERKGPEELNAWMYVEDKAMEWLIKKTERVAKVLKEKQINVSGSATSKNFIKAVKDVSTENDIYLKNAHGLVSEYLTDDFSLKLLLRLGLPQETDEKPKNKRKSSVIEEKETSKKVKVKEEEEEMEEVPRQERPKVLNAKEKAMKKAAAGSKSITSFFSKT